MYKGCVVTTSKRVLLMNLVLMGIQDFNVILGMDWLAPCHASVDYFQTKSMTRLPEFGVTCLGVLEPPCLISAILAE